MACLAGIAALDVRRGFAGRSGTVVTTHAIVGDAVVEIAGILFPDPLIFM